MEIKKIAMVGLGTMGNQIAMQCALCGYEVHGYSRRQTTVDKAQAFSDDWFAKRVAKGKMTQEEADEVQGRLTWTNDLEKACTGVDLVLEAVADVIDTKKKVLAQVDAQWFEAKAKTPADNTVEMTFDAASLDAMPTAGNITLVVLVAKPAE